MSKKLTKHLLFLAMLGCVMIYGCAAGDIKGIRYQLLRDGDEIIHVVKFDPIQFQIKLIRANHHGEKETVSEVADRTNAVAAINGSFFNINNEQELIPSWLLKINGRYEGWTSVKHGAIGWNTLNDNDILFDVIKPRRVDRNIIGFVTLYGTDPEKWQEKQNILMGMPLLIFEGRILVGNIEDMPTRQFVQAPHARTAIGLTKDKQMLLVVVENDYLSGRSDITGVSLNGLAKLMQKLGCDYALNLDGGHSSVLYYQGKVKNVVANNFHEDYLTGKERPVADVIAVIPKK